MPHSRLFGRRARREARRGTRLRTALAAPITLVALFALVALVALVAPVAGGLVGPGSAASVGAATTGAPPGTPAVGATTITVHPLERPVGAPSVTSGLPGGAWQGFGINWNAIPYRRTAGIVVHGYHGLGSASRWDVWPWRRDRPLLLLDEQRLLALRPAYVRMSWAFDWFDPTYRVGRYRWHTPAMEDRRQVLTFLQQHGIPVISGMWTPPLHTVPYGSTRWAALQAALVKHVVRSWHVTDIRYWIGGNEPNDPRCPPDDCAISMSSWAAATARLHRSFQRAGLLPEVQLLGPTVSPRPPWDGWPARGHAVANWPAALAKSRTIAELGGVDWHQYLWTNGAGQPTTGRAALSLIRRFDVRGATASIVDRLRSTPTGSRLPTFVSEFGFGNEDESRHDGVPSVPYALAMLEFAISLARSGVNGASIWQLDPDIASLAIASDGLWDPKPPHRPWPLYRAFAMMTKALPPGSVVEPLSSDRDPGGRSTGASNGGSTVRALVARIPAVPGPAWSVLLVDDGTSPQRVTVRGLFGASLQRYLLTGPGTGTSGASVLHPTSTVAVNGDAVSTVVPAQSAVLLGP